jgi:hypothetical protein
MSVPRAVAGGLMLRIEIIMKNIERGSRRSGGSMRIKNRLDIMIRTNPRNPLNPRSKLS